MHTALQLAEVDPRLQRLPLLLSINTKSGQFRIQNWHQNPGANTGDSKNCRRSQQHAKQNFELTPAFGQVDKKKYDAHVSEMNEQPLVPMRVAKNAICQ